MASAPYGKRYVVEGTDRVLRVNPEEQGVVDTILDLYRQGHDTKVIAEYLMRHGTLCRDSAKWHRSTVLRIIERANIPKHRKKEKLKETFSWTSTGPNRDEVASYPPQNEVVLLYFYGTTSGGTPIADGEYTTGGWYPAEDTGRPLWWVSMNGHAHHCVPPSHWSRFLRVG